MPVKVSTRALTEEDLAWVAAMEQDSFESPWTIEGLRGELGAAFGLAIAALGEDGEPLGFVLARSLYEDAHLLKIAITPARRGQGLGGSLLAAYEESVRERGAELSIVDVRVSNEAAKALYLGTGYRIVATRPRYYTNGEDALLMFKDLEPAPPEG
jgi:[ribosomal protein S18]-alanine N-acetyltransferase